MRIRPLLPRLFIALLLGAAFVAGCRHQSTVQRVVPGLSTGLYSQASESELAVHVVCHDTLGRPPRPTIRVEVSRCTPCIPYGMQASAERSVSHARQMWLQGARAPYDTFDIGAGCVRLAYKYARALRPDDDSLSIEVALVLLADSRDSSRSRALFTVDSLLQRRIADGRPADAARMLSQLAMGMWDRAQRQLERPDGINEDRLERHAHQLASGAPVLTRLPPIPATSATLGESEAEWSARLFDAAARLSTSPASRSQYMRLALAPWVVLERWEALDSTARALLLLAPGDSSLLPARALAAYRTMSRPVRESPRVMALFDSALAHLPRADSMRFDTFDQVLSIEDDEWRYGLLPDRRIALDLRGWSVIDPLWSTPVNEVKLARRARVAEADYRYADIARTNESGSETRPGQMLVRRGAPSPRWTIATTRYGRTWMQRSWRGLTATTEIEDAPSTWRVFYGPRFTPLHASTYEPPRTCTARVDPFPSLYACAIGQRADWSDVPFYGHTDEIDVTAARFRAGSDSADMYIGARIPLRQFKNRDDATAANTDRISLGTWLTTESGATIFHATASRELPAANTLAWTQQWTHRVGPLRMMHRVEAIETSRPSGARGIARFTSDAQVAFPLRGFGMSDVLIAASAAPRHGPANRWHDLELQPNGASVAPGARFAMIWEVYDLIPGEDGRVHWRVRIKRERANMVVHSDMPAVLSGSPSAGSRMRASESTAPDLAYARDAKAAGVVLDNITFGVSDAPIGYHVVNVTIDDLVSGKSVTRGVSVRVLDPATQRRRP